ncbi:viroplasmin family protein [Fusobacterium sp.]|uniref:ribonuclease H1 domain-containing protein n=1 Tax=Fusobacterium sp. TaxID=68766 RepID=UPI002605EB77|nr:viroplasmin family protein [Fusobacterium sp.]
MSKKFYGYYIPETNESGILESWGECSKKVLGRKSQYKSFFNYNEAKLWLDSILNPNNSSNLTHKTNLKQKFYGCFFIDSETFSVFDNWEKCKNKIEQFKCRYKSFKTYEEAYEWCSSGAQYITKKSIQNNLPDGIYFDAGTGRGIGVESKVSYKDGISILPKYFPNENINEFGNLSLGSSKTNNFGELKALDMALDIALKNNILEIFGDSSLIINYWSKGHIKSDIDPETIELAKIVSKKRELFEKLGGTISHISGDYNPADLGFHK